MKYSAIFPLAILISVIQLAGTGCSGDRKPPESPTIAGTDNLPARKTVGSTGATDFVGASSEVTPAVVHIKTRYNSPATTRSPFEEPFGAPSPAAGSGSGVIISPDGYIATNNHVIENASAIEVILPDRRAFTAKLIGRDPNTDLALIKIDATRLPAVTMGNSDNVQVGEWVLAVGYPLSLNTTVTAGIISAKGRSIGIINRSGASGFDANARGGNTAIESFLQTDAAINPGNSGGALVNTDGDLIGINTAIASQTGSYAGYAFAVPVNLAKKILDDLRKFGSVKRGMLGVSFPSPAVEDQYFRQKGIDPASVKGVYIIDVQKGMAADAAGLREGDIIQSVDGVQISSSSEFSEWIARHRPGDVIKLTYLRDGKTTTASVKLQEERKVVSRNAEAVQEILAKLGAEFGPLSDRAREYYELNSGVVVVSVAEGGFFDQLGILAGTIIVLINGKAVNDPGDIGSALLSARSSIVQILGIAPDGSRIAFNFSLGT